MGLSEAEKIQQETEQQQRNAAEYVLVVDDISGNTLVTKKTFSLEDIGRVISKALENTSAEFRTRLAQVATYRFINENVEITEALEQFLKGQAHLDSTYSDSLQAASTIHQRLQRDVKAHERNPKTDRDTFLKELDSVLRVLDQLDCIEEDALVFAELVTHMEEPARAEYMKALIEYAKKIKASNRNVTINADHLFGNLNLDGEGNPLPVTEIAN